MNLKEEVEAYVKSNAGVNNSLIKYCVTLDAQAMALEKLIFALLPDANKEYLNTLFENEKAEHPLKEYL